MILSQYRPVSFAQCNLLLRIETLGLSLGKYLSYLNQPTNEVVTVKKLFKLHSFALSVGRYICHILGMFVCVIFVLCKVKEDLYVFIFVQVCGFVHYL